MLEINLRNKVAIVTGVSSGIGKGVAKMLAQAGCIVSGCGRTDKNDASVNEFSATAKQNGVESLYTEVDVTKDADLEKLVENTVKRFGKIDILVSNAGVNVFKGAEKCTEEDWIYNHKLNLSSHWMVCKLCKPHLDKSGNGVIIIMTSNHAFSSIPGCFPYNVTKTALTGLVRSLAMEWGPKIRTIGMAPGFIETPGNDKWFASFPDAEAERQWTIKLHPAGKLGTVEEVGAFCAYLGSDYARFMTGTTYLMDGGRSALMQDE
ncbi:3-oxoacyl-[acyl-carrier protein] reductase [Aquipluma nitroreducens]|uniref:3-oxoacyl-[acyl-carrier protein] reductase n=1 Tax=Aquipluma nitroreducens TaxID=2010828 RepID=A0A5K7S3L4_9BACT|nr:SDR family oxidoreductase [Aquipluma nitroreducens]BBE16087.1 3-oxoacyl-[acyl-carrier protein] reductase [Aquipluma nitroreducens]